MDTSFDFAFWLYEDQKKRSKEDPKCIECHKGNNLAKLEWLAGNSSQMVLLHNPSEGGCWERFWNTGAGKNLNSNPTLTISNPNDTNGGLTSV